MFVTFDRDIGYRIPDTGRRTPDTGADRCDLRSLHDERTSSPALPASVQITHCRADDQPRGGGTTELSTAAPHILIDIHWQKCLRPAAVASHRTGDRLTSLRVAAEAAHPAMPTCCRTVPRFTYDNAKRYEREVLTHSELDFWYKRKRYAKT